jgi:hypothetical protein
MGNSKEDTMNNHLLLAFITAAGAGLAIQADAHIGDRIYPTHELTNADLAAIDLKDGSVGDWEEVLGDPTLTAVDFIMWGGYDPADFDFRIWLGWQDATDRIYVAMEQVDDVYANVYDRTNAGYSMISHDGALVVRVDGDHSGGKYRYANPEFDTIEEWALFSNQKAQAYIALGEVFDQGSHIGTIVTEILNQKAFESVYDDWFVQSPYAEGGGASLGEHPAVTITELYVTPFDLLIWNSREQSQASDLHAGKVIGMALDLQDYDQPLGAQESAYWLPDTPAGMFSTADGFADFVLVGAGDNRSAVSAVGTDSWARIKAAFGE